jgi:Fic family protein
MSVTTPEGHYRPFPKFNGWLVPTFDPTAVDREAERLASARREHKERFDDAVMRASRYAAVDTGAIEGLYTVDRGFTRTIAERTSGWEARFAEKGERAKRSIADAMRAYEFVLDAVTGRWEVSAMFVRELHAIICASQGTYNVKVLVGPPGQAELRDSQRELPLGTYKVMPNSPTKVGTSAIFHYAPVADTAPEMDRLIMQLRSPEFQAAHPVVQAAYAHYAFVRIHPFADGNGRVARTLGSVYLYRAPGVPLVVFNDQKDEYLDALEQADAGNAVPFVLFVERCVVNTAGLILTSLDAPATVAESLTAISSYHRVHLLSEQEERGVERLQGLVSAEFREQISQLDMPAWLTIDVGLEQPSPVHFPRVAGYAHRAATTGDASGVTLWAHGGPHVSVSYYIRIDTATSDNAPSDFLLRAVGGHPLEVWFRDVAEVVSQQFAVKLSAWVAARLGAVLVRVREAIGA